MDLGASQRRRDALLDRIAARERAIAALHAEQLADIVALAGAEQLVDHVRVATTPRGRERTVQVCDAVREELACTLRISPTSAHRLIGAARTLTGSLPATLAALASGDVSLAHARAVAEAADRLPASAHAGLEARLLPVARTRTPGHTRSRAARAVLALDPHGHARPHRSARAARDVQVLGTEDGITTLLARLTTLQAHAVMTAVDAHAPACDGQHAGERRAAALVGLVVGGGAVAVDLHVSVDLPTLLDLQDCTAPVADTPHGPIPLDDVRAVLADPDTRLTLRRLVTDPVTGHLLDLGRRSYEPTAALRRFITARDRTCRFPGCSREASRCQIDHIHPWQDDGPTTLDNLQALCTRHHQLKTHARWHACRAPDGTTTWTTPTGRRHDAPPDG